MAPSKESEEIFLLETAQDGVRLNLGFTGGCEPLGEEFQQEVCLPRF